jgi:hypothetical protein
MQDLIRRTLVGAVALAAVGAPGAAQARPMPDPPAVRAPAPHTVAVGRSSFRWDDAGVGAGTVILLGTGALAVAGGRRRTAGLRAERAS